MTKTAVQRLFGAAGKAALKAYNYSVHKLDPEDRDAALAATEKIREFLHTLSGPRPGQTREIVREALAHAHHGKNYDDIEMVIKDLADISITLKRLSQRRNRTRSEKLQEAIHLCDHFKHY